MRININLIIIGWLSLVMISCTSGKPTNSANNVSANNTVLASNKIINSMDSNNYIQASQRVAQYGNFDEWLTSDGCLIQASSKNTPKPLICPSFTGNLGSGYNLFPIVDISNISNTQQFVFYSTSNLSYNSSEPSAWKSIFSFAFFMPYVPSQSITGGIAYTGSDRIRDVRDFVGYFIENDNSSAMIGHYDEDMPGTTPFEEYHFPDFVKRISAIKAFEVDQEHIALLLFGTFVKDQKIQKGMIIVNASDISEVTSITPDQVITPGVQNPDNSQDLGVADIITNNNESLADTYALFIPGGVLQTDPQVQYICVLNIKKNTCKNESVPTRRAIGQITTDGKRYNMLLTEDASEFYLEDTISNPGVWVKTPVRLNNYLDCLLQNNQNLFSRSEMIALCGLGSSRYVSMPDMKTWIPSNIPSFRQIFSGQNTIYAITNSQTQSLYSWGSNVDVQMGIKESYPRIMLPYYVNAMYNIPQKMLSGGSNHACAVAQNGNLYCWGNNQFGQLGDGTTSNKQIPVKLSLSNITKVSLGTDFSCAIDNESSLYCWGINKLGQLGVDPQESSYMTKPHKISTESSLVTSLATGFSHICVLNESSEIDCWGGNDVGQLGNGDITDDPVIKPQKVMFVTDRRVGYFAFKASQISSSGETTCAIAAKNPSTYIQESTAYCWGRNDLGQIGNSQIESSMPVPIAVTGNLKYIALYSGIDHTCGITDNHQGVCWGDDSVGQLGIDKISNQPMPQPQYITGNHYWISLTVGRNFTCGIAADDSNHTNYITYCWGTNILGQIGTDSDGVDIFSSPQIITAQ